MKLKYFTINTILLFSALNYFLLTNNLHLFPDHTKLNFLHSQGMKPDII